MQTIKKYMQLFYLGCKFMMKKKSLFSVYVLIASCLHSGKNILLPIAQWKTYKNCEEFKKNETHFCNEVYLILSHLLIKAT